jgi:hypothetical protein
LEQRSVENLLEVTDLLTQRRLRDVERLRSDGELLGERNRDETP